MVLEKFTRVRFAEWAGDFVYAHTLLNQVSAEFDGKLAEVTKAHPLSVLHNNLGVLKDRLEHMNNIKSESVPHIFEEFDHIRGVIWRVGRNEFEMRAYLNNFNWEEELYQRVAGRTELPNETLNWSPLRGSVIEVTNELARQTGSHPRRGGSWILDTKNFYREVVVSDIGIIRVKGLWVKRQLPRSRIPIVRGFRDVLMDLDGRNEEVTR